MGPEEIEELEAQVEELRDSIRRSRRLMLAGRATVVIGLALLVVLLIGALDFTPTRMIVAIALAIGGVVLSGSSRSSTDELERALRLVEAERQAALDGAEFVQLGD
jgi:O-antigen ligase